MISAPIPKNEDRRLKAIASYDIFDTLPEQDFDDLTAIASQICQVPISLISLIDEDRQWFKSRVGLPVSETPRDVSFCGHVINEPDSIFIIPDSRKDERFHDNPLVEGEPQVIFYAGVPLVNPEGFPLGTLCVIDHKSRRLEASQIEALKGLARQVVSQLELRRKVQQLESAKNHIDILHKDLSEIAYRVSHDLKTPSRGIQIVTDWLIREHYQTLNEGGKEYLDLLLSQSQRLETLLEGFVQYCQTTTVFETENQPIEFPGFWEEVKHLIDPPSGCIIEYPSDSIVLNQYKTGLLQIFEQLLNNSLQNCDPSRGRISLSLSKSETQYLFQVIDNGPGIPEEYRNKVFNLFEKLSHDQHENRSGIGLTLVKSVLNRMNGTISIMDRPDGMKGTCIEISLPINPV